MNSSKHKNEQGPVFLDGFLTLQALSVSLKCSFDQKTSGVTYSIDTGKGNLYYEQIRIT